jgi:hypothetical protein
MITQSVLYRPFPGNPNAAPCIVGLARRLLSDIPGTELRVGPAIQSDRAVNISNGLVIKTTTWADETAQRAYFAHPQLQRYVRDVLRGWKLAGDPDGSADAFIAHILSGSASREWARDNSVPDDQVLWGGEQITLYEWH